MRTAGWIRSGYRGAAPRGSPRRAGQLRFSRHFGSWIERKKRLAAREKAREKFLVAVGAGRASFNVVKLPLLPYLREGAAHLAFHERALLADAAAAR